jgi:predicted phage terminase large subunit-like protein
LIAFYVRTLKGFAVDGRPASGSKMVRADSFASQVNAGNVRMLKAPWNKRYLAQLASFPRGAHDDDVDSSSGAFNELTGGDSWDTVKFGSV